MAFLDNSETMLLCPLVPGTGSLMGATTEQGPAGLQRQVDHKEMILAKVTNA